MSALSAACILLQRMSPLLCRVADAGQGTQRHAPTAGVGNWPRDEIAGGGAPRVQLALWGFQLARRDDGGGSAPWSRLPENSGDADPGSRAARTRLEDGDLTAAATVGDRDRAHSANAGR